MSENQILTLIYAAISEVNQQRDEDHQLVLEPDAVLFGNSGGLDSLGLVSLILDIEERVSDVFGKSITLADDRAMSQRNSPFRTATSLADYITLLLGEVDA